MLKLEKFVKEEIEIRLKDLVGNNVYLEDLGYRLFEYENINGIYYNRYEAIQWIKDYFEELDEVVEEYEIEFGDSVPNPFSEPEKFQIVIILYIANKLVYNALYNINLNIYKKIKLTNDIIDTILKVL